MTVRMWSRARQAARTVALALLCAWAGIAAAHAAYPDHAIRVIVPFAPGGGVDVAARVYSQKLSAVLGQPVVVENIGGAGGILAATQVAHARPDGYTILFGGIATHGILPGLHTNLPYDPIKDFSPVIAFVRQPLILVVNPQLPVKSVAELIALAKSEPGKLKFASAGVGGSIHLMGEMFNSMAHVDITHVPYTGAGPALVDVLANYVQMTYSPYEPVREDVQAGKLRALAVTSLKPSALMPGLPPIADTLPGYDATSWYGILLPAGTPQPIVDQLNHVTADMFKDKDFTQQLAKIGLEPIGGSPADFSAFIKSEIAKWSQTIREAKVPLQP